MKVESEISKLKQDENALHGNPVKTIDLNTVNFTNLVRKINDAYQLDWEKQKLEFAQNFLARTWAGMPLPVLSICGKELKK